MPSQVPKRRNGCSPPYSGAQITAWVCLLVVFLEFLLIVAPVMPVAASVPVTLLFCAMNAAVVYFGTYTLLVDPMDPHLAKHLRDRNNSSPTSQQQSSSRSKPSSSAAIVNRLYDRFNPVREEIPDEDMKHCWTCDTQVAEHSMHCKFCNKCISHFDHHCIWLNTCIGEANYRYFFRTIVSILYMHSTHLIVQLALVIDSFMGGSTQDRAENWFRNVPNGAVAVNAIMIFFLVFDAVSIILVGQLVWFHMVLRKSGMTTYQYIVKDHQTRRDSSYLREQLESKRVVALAKARDEGRTWYVFRLRAGGMFRTAGCTHCDPLQLPGSSSSNGNSNSNNGNSNNSNYKFVAPGAGAGGVTTSKGEENPPSSCDAESDFASALTFSLTAATSTRVENGNGSGSGSHYNNNNSNNNNNMPPPSSSSSSREEEEPTSTSSDKKISNGDGGRPRRCGGSSSSSGSSNRKNYNSGQPLLFPSASGVPPYNDVDEDDAMNSGNIASANGAAPAAAFAAIPSDGTRT